MNGFSQRSSMEVFRGTIPEGAQFLYFLNIENKTQLAKIRRLVLCYLLQYQHYNAELTKVETERLGYPAPIFVPLPYSSYLRSDGRRLLALAEPWIERVPLLQDRKDRGSRARCLIITNSLFFEVTALFCPEMNRLTRREISLSNLTDSEFPAKWVQAEKINTITLFQLQIPTVDCVWIWGVKVEKNYKLRWLPRKELPIGGRLSILNKAVLFQIAWLFTNSSLIQTTLSFSTPEG